MPAAASSAAAAPLTLASTVGADREFFHNSGVEWDLRLVNDSYRWVEHAIVFRPELKNWQSAIRDGLLEAGVHPYHGYTVEHVTGTKIGGSTFDRSGRRHSSADLLNGANAVNIRVGIYATTERILLASLSRSRSKSRQASPICTGRKCFIF